MRTHIYENKGENKGSTATKSLLEKNKKLLCVIFSFIIKISLLWKFQLKLFINQNIETKLKVSSMQ